MKSSLRRARRRVALTAIGIACALAGVGFLFAAGFMELADLLGAIRAGLIVGAVLLVAGVVFILWARRPGAAASANPLPHDSAALATTMVDVGREIGAAAARHPGSLVLAAFVAGLFLSGGRTRR
jgi:hypothetical protein